MKKRILSLLIATGLAMSMSITIIAAPLTQQLENQKKQLEKQQSSYTKAQMDSEKLDISIEMLDSDIEGTYLEIDKAKGEINDIEIKIEQTTKDIVDADSNIKEEEA